MSTDAINKTVIETVLAKLDYYDLNFLAYDENTNNYWYDGYLDTAYRIHVIVKSPTQIGVWDCIHDEENYVRAGVAYLTENDWEVTSD